jgi:preprotein translocase subunit SecY
MNFLHSIANIFRIPDLRRRVLFTLGLLTVYRLGSYIPLPGVDFLRWEDFYGRNQGDVWSFFNLFAGGNIQRLTIFALNVMPYITASIVLQVLAVALPALQKLQKEGEQGRRKMTQWTRYLTVMLAVAESALVAAGLASMPGGVVVSPGLGFTALTIISLTAGTVFLMWLGEQISDRGIGNGISLIIFTGIVSGLRDLILNIHTNVFVTREWGPITLGAVLLLMLGIVAFVVLVERAERRVPVQYAQRIAGRRILGGQSTHMPLKLSVGGVIPVIFASSVLAAIQVASGLTWMRRGEPLYYALFVAGILFFNFFYVSIIFNPNEVADNLRRYGGYIPGIRPGRETARYLDDSLTKITVADALYLAILCLIPDLMIAGIKLQHLPLIGNWIDTWAPRFVLEGLNVRINFGGTSLLIAVGVAMDLVNQVEAQLIMRHYEGFAPRAGRIRGRRYVKM